MIRLLARRVYYSSYLVEISSYLLVDADTVVVTMDICTISRDASAAGTMVAAVDGVALSSAEVDMFRGV